MGRGQNIGLSDFCHTCISTLLPPGAFYLLPSNTITTRKFGNETQNLYSCSCLSILFVCLFVFNFYFVLIFELFHLLLILFIYFIYLFIYVSCHLNFLENCEKNSIIPNGFIYLYIYLFASQFSRNARPFPFITTDKNPRSAPVLYATIFSAPGTKA